HRPHKQGCREGRVPAVTCGPLRKSTRRENRTAAYRCSQITRPSLRSGFTAYAVLSREPSSFWPPSPSRNSRTSRRLTRMPPPQRLDRSNDGQDHTVLPYARSLTATGFDDIVHVAIEMLARRTNSAARRHEALGLTESNPPCPRLS